MKLAFESGLEKNFRDVELALVVGYLYIVTSICESMHCE